MPGVDWILVFATLGCLQLEKHRHAVAAEAEEHALPQAENAAIAPAQHQPERDEGVGQIFADQVEAEDIERTAAGSRPGTAASDQDADQLGAIEKRDCRS